MLPVRRLGERLPRLAELAPRLAERLARRAPSRPQPTWRSSRPMAQQPAGSAAPAPPPGHGKGVCRASPKVIRGTGPPA